MIFVTLPLVYYYILPTLPPPISPPVPPDPVITGPTSDVWENNDVVLFCTSPDNQMIEWFGVAINESGTFEITGNMFNSTLTIHNARIEHSGIYVCRVGGTVGFLTLTIVGK